MLIWVFAWVVGGALFAVGVRYLLHLKRSQWDHEERMAEIATERERVGEELERSRAERANRTRPDLAAEVAEAYAAIDAPTEVFEPAPPPTSAPAVIGEELWPPPLDGDGVDQDQDSGKHWLPTPN